MAAGIRTSRFRRALLALIRTLRRPRPYSLKWQLAEARGQLRQKDDELRELRATLDRRTVEASRAVLEVAGIATVFDRAAPDPLPDQDDSRILTSPEDRDAEAAEWFRKCRQRFAELMDDTPAEVLAADQRGIFDDPNWNIYDRRWWATIGKQMEEDKARRATR